MPTSTRLVGHVLPNEGRIYEPWGQPITVGPARCTCGAESPVLTSDNARKKWHRDVHKPAVRNTPEERRS